MDETARAWDLCEDSLVIDLMNEAPRAVLDAMRGTAKRAILPHWGSSDSARGASQWHYNHSPPSTGQGAALAPSPVSGAPRRAVTGVLSQKGYQDWRSVWETVKEILHVPKGCELVRVYQNVYPYGADGCAHTDSDNPDEVTMCLYLHPTWDGNWGGETVLLDPNGEVHRAVLPQPGRLFAFRSAVPHAARPVARAAVPPRTVLVLKMGPWPVERPVATAAPDAVLARRPSEKSASPPEGWKRFDPSARIALAVQWVLASRAQRMAHGRTSLAAHLVATATWLNAWGLDQTTVLGGLAHALCGTQRYRPRCFDPVADRAALEEVFTPEGMALALAFASCDRKALAQTARDPPHGDGPFTLRRDARGPEGAEAHGALSVTSETLEGLLYIQAANQLTMSRIENCMTFEAERASAP